ncbi:MAG TPA: hypothetical protein VHX88_08440 [Solirubrobacteraceae bacterium]|jgi:hypothetical protein|nr:hypothetical protein [Solirubrobacteraceae bacterium]
MELRRGAFEIEVDSKPVGSINKIGETVEIPVEPGHHTLQMRSGRYSSPERPFDVADGEVVDFHTRGPLVWPVYVATLLKPDLGLSLKRD